MHNLSVVYQCGYGNSTSGGVYWRPFCNPYPLYPYLHLYGRSLYLLVLICTLLTINSIQFNFFLYSDFHNGVTPRYSEWHSVGRPVIASFCRECRVKTGERGRRKARRQRRRGTKDTPVDSKKKRTLGVLGQVAPTPQVCRHCRIGGACFKESKVHYSAVCHHCLHASCLHYCLYLHYRQSLG